MANPAFIFDDVCVPPDRQIGWHSHGNWELSLVLCGGGTRTIGDHSGPIQTGEIVLIPPEIPHIWKFDDGITDCNGNIANISIFFDASLLAGIRGLFPETARSLEILESYTHAIAYTGSSLEKIRELVLSMRSLTPELRVPGMIELLLMISNTSENVAAGKNDMRSRAERKMEKVRVYCACNYARSLSPGEVSRHVGMNKSAFCTFMRRHAAMTLSEYVNGMRLDRAKDKLLNSECGIAEIAMDCGFQNISYFNRLFRAKFGCTPRSIRGSKKQ